MLRPALLLPLVILAITACAGSSATQNSAVNLPPAPAFYPDDPACRVKSVRKTSTVYENAAIAPVTGMVAITRPDTKGVYQVYVAQSGSDSFRCISCAARQDAPRLDRNKPMISWHPSGRWLVVGVEENTHDNAWMPASWQRGFLQSGIWLNMWMTTSSGDRWVQLTNFKKSASNPSDGYVGTAFTPDGRKAVWAEIVDGNIFVNHFGKWKLYVADIMMSPDGAPFLANKTDITPKGARWVEPGNFSPDGRHILISTDIGLSDAQGQDQWSLDITAGALQQLTNTPTVWDEHGLYSPDGRKISFMSSYPYRKEKDTYKISNIKTEFMLMNADGSHLQQLTHFNTPGYPESQPGHTVAAVAGFLPGDGSQIFATVLAPDFSFGKTNWIIAFEGNCGSNAR